MSWLRFIIHARCALISLWPGDVDGKVKQAEKEAWLRLEENGIRVVAGTSPSEGRSDPSVIPSHVSSLADSDFHPLTQGYRIVRSFSCLTVADWSLKDCPSSDLLTIDVAVRSAAPSTSKIVIV